MSRTYAGILGPLAMAVVLCRGLFDNGGVEGTLTRAIQYLILFSIAGAVIGLIAQNTIDESVRAKLQQQFDQT